MSSAAPAPLTEYVHDMPKVRPINMPRLKYVRDGGQVGSKLQEDFFFHV